MLVVVFLVLAAVTLSAVLFVGARMEESLLDDVEPQPADPS